MPLASVTVTVPVMPCRTAWNWQTNVYVPGAANGARNRLAVASDVPVRAART